MQKGKPQSLRNPQKKAWFRRKFSKLITAVVGWFIAVGLLSLLPNNPAVRHPLTIGIFYTNLPFLIYHFVRYIASRRDNDLPRRAQYAQLVKGNIMLAWWGWVYAPIEALPDAGKKAGLVPILFLIGVWYLCTAGSVRRREEEKIRSAQENLSIEQNAGVWPPPPTQP